MLASVLDPLRQGLTQRAIAEVVVLGLACGPLGTWVVLMRRAYAAESFSHAMFPGLVLAALAGAPLVAGAAGGVVVAALGVTLVGSDRRLGSDAAIAVAVTTLFGLGALLALSPATPPRLGDLLFGDLLGTAPADLARSAALAAAVLAALAAAHRPLSATAFDPGTARALGVRPGRAQLALLLLIGVAIVAGVQALGNLLVLALLVAPGAAALLLTRRLPAALALSGALAAVAGIAGVYASYYLDIAAGASVALAAVAIYAVAALARPAPGGAGALRRSPVEALAESR